MLLLALKCPARILFQFVALLVYLYGTYCNFVYLVLFDILLCLPLFDLKRNFLPDRQLSELSIGKARSPLLYIQSNVKYRRVKELLKCFIQERTCVWTHEIVEKETFDEKNRQLLIHFGTVSCHMFEKIRVKRKVFCAF